MRAHQEWRDQALDAGTRLDRLGAELATAQLRASANAARWLRGLGPIDHTSGPATPHQLALDLPLARLLHYPGKGAPVLVVPSLINRFHVLDLLPDLSVLRLLGERGCDVYVLDWKAPGAAGPRLRFTDYIDDAIASAAGEIARVTGQRPSLLGYCMGGTMATIFAARHPELLRSLCLLGSPIDFHQSGLLARWTERRYFDVDQLVDTYGNMPSSLMQTGFKLLGPIDALLKAWRMLEDGGDEQRLRHRVALESWLADNSAFPGGVYREYIRELYQGNALALGTLRLGGGAALDPLDPVDLRRITMPVLNVVASRDHICEPPASRVLEKLAASSDYRLLEFDTGHIGLTTSRRAHRQLWPEIAGWLTRS